MANNEFLHGRIVSAHLANHTVYTAATYLEQPVYVPAGAIVTGVTMMLNESMTTANCDNTMNLYVSTDIPLGAVTAISDILKTNQTPEEFALLTTAGMYISKGGPLYLLQGVSNGTAAWTFHPDCYVGYLKA